MPENTTLISKKQYPLVDIFKLLVAVLVVFMHANSFYTNGANQIVFIFSNLGVPFFFIASGFFFKKGLDRTDNKKAYFLKFEKNTLLLYAFWAIINIPIYLFIYNEKYDGSSILNIILINVRRFIFCGVGVTWYILVMAEAAAIIYLLDIFRKKKLFVFLIAIGFISCIINDCFGIYMTETTVGCIIWKAIYTVFAGSNNFIMKGIPFMGVGYFLAVKPIRIKMYVLWIVFILASAINLFLFYAYSLTNILLFYKAWLYFIFNDIQAVVLFIIAINAENIKINPNITKICRELSSSIYFLHTYIIYYLIDIFMPSIANGFLRVLLAIVGTVIVYVICKLLNIRLFKFALNIKA
ncbi:MAG: acyltransferase [Ruminococcus sp.]|nr:acyltransferase [Ruminococcus sp.]